MARTITVKAGDALRPGEVAIWEVNPEHPDGEVMIAAPHAGEDALTFEVARTPEVNKRLSDGRLVETEAKPKSAPAPTASGQSTTPRPPLAADAPIEATGTLTEAQRQAMVAAGFSTVGDVRTATDQQLDAVEGIGNGTIERLREATRE